MRTRDTMTRQRDGSVRAAAPVSAPLHLVPWGDLAAPCTGPLRLPQGCSCRSRRLTCPAAPPQPTCTFGCSTAWRSQCCTGARMEGCRGSAPLSHEDAHAGTYACLLGSAFAGKRDVQRHTYLPQGTARCPVARPRRASSADSARTSSCISATGCHTHTQGT